MGWNDKYVEVSSIVGKVFSKVEQVYDDVIYFTQDDGTVYKMYHDQDCCEGVSIESVVGDLQDLVGTPILLAEEATNSDEYPEGVDKPEWEEDSFTWTFYKFATIKGYVDIRWYGSSNGYYSECVDFVVVNDD